MKRDKRGKPGIVLPVLAAILLIGVAMEAEAIQIDIYSGYSTCHDTVNCWGGAPYSGYAGSLYSPDVLFATNTGYDWHPFGLKSFGALVTGYLNVDGNGSFAFTLNSDDGSMLYIDGSLVVNNGYDNGHDPRKVSGSASLLAGIHAFRIEFFEDFGGQSGLDLYLPPGVTYVPEPLTVVLMSLGLLGIAGFRRRAQ
ncbi:MAG TPA: PA14 domain-containing protein [Syntrophales bacterium]|nr:PA14 domain-containing protein [Syntrophales bacterium]